MSENAVPLRETTQPFTASSPRQGKRWQRLPLLTIGGVAGALVLLLFLTINKAGVVYALITPPHTPDFTATGENGLQQFGFSVASAGDINNDGYGDVVVGANNLNNAIYVYTGSNTGLVMTPFFEDVRPSIPIEGLGHSVDGGGDVNNDGVDDIIAGAPLSVTAAGAAGAAYIYYGSSVTLPTLAVTLTGEAVGDNFGWSVAIIGDVNNDNISDIAIGAYQYGITDTGRVYIFHGPVTSSASAATADIILNGEGDLDGFGVSVAGASDVNGDGIDDLIVGAWQNDDGGNDAGKAYLFYGSNSGINQGNFTAVTGEANDKFGTSVHGAGDVNGDGFADVIVGADTYNEGSPSLGYFSIYPGGPSGLITTPIFTREGEGNNDHFGFAVAGDGDLDGDGFSDFATGAYFFDVVQAISTTNEGKAYGYVSCTDGAISPSLLFSDTGESAEDQYGRSLAVVSDVNGDGLDDLVVGAYTGKNDVPLPTGEIFAYYGVEGGCRPAVELTKTVGLANFPAIYTNTSVITVPTDAVVRYHYTVRNSGNVTLTQQSAVDDELGVVTQTTHTLIPGGIYSANMIGTPGSSASPGISITNVATWTSALPISSPSGVTTPTNRVLSALAVATAQVNISGPTTDQDGDTIPDNVEGSGDNDGDGLPNYLDANDNSAPVAIGGLAIDAPAIVIIDQAVDFTAVITAGTNVTYTWDFGDGHVVTTTSQTITHTYTTPDFYLVTLTATNSLGMVETTKSIRVRHGLFMPILARFYFPADN